MADIIDKKIRKLAKEIGALCRKNKLSISTAESCTGGLLASYLTDISGSSDYFILGKIVYSNEAKVKELQVNPEILKKFGAVSSQVAAEMAQNLQKIAGTDIAIAVTGIAGPKGGTKEKPVGTLWLAIGYNNQVYLHKCLSQGLRTEIKQLSCYKILIILQKYLKKS